MNRFASPLLVAALLAACATPTPPPAAVAAKGEATCIRVTGSNVCKRAGDGALSNVQVIQGDAIRRAGPEVLGAPPTPGP